MTQTHSTWGVRSRGAWRNEALSRDGEVLAGCLGKGVGRAVPVGALGQVAGLVGRWPVEQQACDGQSSEWHPQTARIGASPRQNQGFPGGDKKEGGDQTLGEGRKGRRVCPWPQPMDMLGQEGPTQGARRQTAEQVGIDRNLVNRVCSAGWELSVPAPPAHLLFYRSGLYKWAQLCPSPWFQL